MTQIIVTEITNLEVKKHWSDEKKKDLRSGETNKYQKILLQAMKELGQITYNQVIQILAMLVIAFAVYSALVLVNLFPAPQIYDVVYMKLGIHDNPNAIAFVSLVMALIAYTAYNKVK